MWYHQWCTAARARDRAEEEKVLRLQIQVHRRDDRVRRAGPHTEKAIQDNITILMTTQTIHGYVGMNVYSTGRELQDLGVIPGRNLLPEVGYIKLGWVLGQTNDSKEIKDLLLSNIAGEFVEREIPIAYNYNIDDLLRNNKL